MRLYYYYKINKKYKLFDEINENEDDFFKIKISKIFNARDFAMM